jgi:hypothetical protein
MQVPPECQALADEIEALEAEIRDWQEELRDAPPGRKPFIVRMIRRAGQEIAARRPALDACIATHNGGPTIPAPLQATFSGRATMTTNNSSAPGPYEVASLVMSLIFDGFRTGVFITVFPEIATDPFNTPLGSNVSTIRKTGGGSGTYSSTTGDIVMPLQLRLDHSVEAPLPFYEEDSDLSITIASTNPGGSPMNASGSITLTGSGTFVGGFLGGSSCNLTVAGVVSPHP